MTTARARAIHEFDHEELARLAAYGRLRNALSDLANESVTVPGLDQAMFTAMVTDMITTSPYGDRCQRCDALAFPSAVRRDAQAGLRGRYRCPECGAEWGCSWAAQPPW